MHIGTSRIRCFRSGFPIRLRLTMHDESDDAEKNAKSGFLRERREII